ncbi:MAG: peptide ABC transporter substrate-binding protein, partial [Chloroflexi bacterium]|nr:peptide ABC transporter substrate-binding protein [Chloroflexota bacterium]
GVPVTAGDLEYTWKRLLNPCMGQGSAGLLYEVRGAKAFHQGRQGIANEVGVRALDERTLAVELEEPTGYFLSLLTCVSTFALPRHVVERFGEAWTELPHIVTSGPFRLESWEPGRVMTFVRNPRYHGASEGNVGTVRLLLTPLSEWQRRLPLFEAGIVDAVDVVGIQQALVADVLQRNPGTRAQRTPGLGVHYLVFDVTRPPFDDARVRRAFVLSTDRRELAREVSICGFLPATGGFTPPGMPGYHQGAALPYDPHQARALLADAGYPEGHNFPEVDFLSILGPATPPMCGLVQANWRQNLGVEVPWRAREWAVYQEAIRTERPHIYVIGWSADYPDPDSFLRVAMAVNSPWRNERYQELVEEARRVRDQDQRMTLYRQAEEILADEAPIMPVDYSENLLLVQPWVKDFPSAPISEFFWQDVVIEPH